MSALGICENKCIQIQHLLKLNGGVSPTSLIRSCIQIQHLLKLNSANPLDIMTRFTNSNTTLVKVKLQMRRK